MVAVVPSVSERIAAWSGQCSRPHAERARTAHILDELPSMTARAAARVAAGRGPARARAPGRGSEGASAAAAGRLGRVRSVGLSSCSAPPERSLTCFAGTRHPPSHTLLPQSEGDYRLPRRRGRSGLGAVRGAAARECGAARCWRPPPLRHGRALPTSVRRCSGRRSRDLGIEPVAPWPRWTATAVRLQGSAPAPRGCRRRSR
jgi:hypothetical protein